MLAVDERVKVARDYAIDSYRVTDDGKISEEWAADDMVAFASQLGAIWLPWAA